MPAGAVDWALAERVAVRAAGREPFAESYHYASLGPDFDELTALAEEQVAAATGLRSLSGPARARVTDRRGWVQANIASFQRLLRPITDRLDEHLASNPFAPVARRVAGAEVGMLLGWMSSRVLGQYDLLVIEDEEPDEQDIVYYVGPNIIGLEKRFAFPPREFRHWLALHEVTHRAQFTGIPWMRTHFLSLVQQTVSAVDPDPKRFLDAIGRLAEGVKNGQNPLDDGGVMAVLASPEQRLVLEQVSGLMSLLEGHGDVTMDRAGADQIPSAARFGQVLRQRRQQGNPAARILQKLIGLEAKLKQYEQGERFIEAVERTGGTDLLEVAWEMPGNLPTIHEIRDPDTWIARVRATAA
ncbi:MAG: Coenzyme biosynthesis-associated protein [Acidimicrobiales bacterium]|nr:Coenzyme biosynthesis-associated protein [Acidimicrobiales bacterium]